MSHLAPKRQPGGGGFLFELCGRKIAIDNSLDAALRRLRPDQAQADVLMHAAHQRAKRGFQQTLFVTEIMGHQTGGNAGARSNLCKRGAHAAEFG